MSKFFNEKIFIVKGARRPFHNKKDALYYCKDNNVDVNTMECYDSKKEYDRYHELRLKERAGLISNLRSQVEYMLIPKYSKQVLTGTKSVKRWGIKTNDLDIYPLDTKKSAMNAIKGIHGARAKDIYFKEHLEEVYKTVILENAAFYTADFVYLENGEVVVEDVKSEYTRKEKDYILRRKLMLGRHGIIIKET